MKTPDPSKPESSAPNTRNFPATGRFTGTDNPRQLRAIAALLRRPTPRAQLDDIVGCANAPELMAELRRRGLDAPCDRIDFIDRDGKPCRPGVYSFTLSDRRKVYAWMTRRKVPTNG
jgi:hypothetical protein